MSKAYNLGLGPLQELKQCISTKYLLINIANLLAASLLPQENQMTCKLHPLKDNFYRETTNFLPKLLRNKKADKPLSEINGKEKGTDSGFHKIFWDGFSPILLNLFIPMGLEKAKGQGSNADQYRRCPFPIGGLNHRERSEGWEEEILLNLFDENPKYTMNDMFAVMGVLKTPIPEIRDHAQQYVIPLHNYLGLNTLDSTTGRLLVGEDKCMKPDGEGMVKCFGSYPLLPARETSTEIHNMFKTIGMKPVDLEDLLNETTYDKATHPNRGDRLQEDMLASTHLHATFFKRLYQQVIIAYTKPETERADGKTETTRQFIQRMGLLPCDYKEPASFHTPVQVMHKIAKLTRLQGGECLIPFFKCLDSSDVASTREDGMTSLPLFTHIGKLLFQGHTTLIDQGMEGNHRLAIGAAVLSGSLPDRHMKKITNLSLNISLLFAQAEVTTLVPNILRREDLTNEKVGGCFVSFFFAQPAQKFLSNNFL